jgi:alpha-ketoglutarate-dependent taurine dioxygenase
MSVNTYSTAEKFAKGELSIAKLAWKRADVLADRSWSVPITPEVLSEYSEFLATVKDPAAVIETVARADVDLPHLADLAARLREQLFGRFGFVHLTGLADGGFSEDEQRLFYVLTCLQLGEMLTPYGRLHEVADRGYDYRSADVSVSKTRVQAPFHTDSTSKRVFPNVFGLLCLRPAMQGGRSLLVSACEVYRQIAEETPEHLLSLFKDHFRNTVTPGDENTSIRDNAYPIFTWDVFAAGPTLRYMRHWIQTGYAKVGETIAPEDAAAFDRLDAVMEDEDNVFDLALAAGETIFINNGVVAHNRTEFTDFPEPNRRRLLARAWLRVPDGSDRLEV